MTPKQVIQILNCCYGIHATTLTKIAAGADNNAAAYKALTPDQGSYFIKVKHGEGVLSADILEFLKISGFDQVITPLKTLNGETTHQLNGTTLVAYPFIEGQDGFTCSLSDQQWVQLGQTLRKLHDLKVTKPIQDRIRKETFSSNWGDAARSIISYLESDPLSNTLAKKMQAFMKQHLPEILHLIEWTEQLSKNLYAIPTNYVLCHSDIHAGNVLLDMNSHLYIVDWDEPIMAPKERDLMFIGGGVGNVWNHPREEELFYQGYGSVEINPTLLAYYRSERILEDLAIYSQEILFRADQVEEREMMYKHFIAQFEPNGVVAIALESSGNST